MSPPPISPRLVTNHPPGVHRRFCRLVLVLLAAVLGVLAVVQPAAAQDAAEIDVRVFEQRRDAGGRTDNAPVAGVTVAVVDASGSEVGSAVTDERGLAAIPVPGPADYTVVLDESTLPEGTSLAAQTPSAEQAITADSWRTARYNVAYFTGESQRATQSNVDRWAQRVSDGVRLGMVIAMCAVGLSLIFGTTGLTNFAHGEMVTFGAMIAFWFNAWMHIVWAALIAVVAGGLLGYAMDRWGFDKLRKRGVGLIPQMIITIGLSILAKNLFQARFGGTAIPYRNYTNQIGQRFGPIVITPRDLTTMVLSLAILLVLGLTLQYTQLGKATRAVSDNRDLAAATGINTARVVRMIWIAAGGLAAIGGVFRGLDESVRYDMGGSLLFLMFSAITLGGLGSAYGALLGGFIVGLLVEMSTLFGVPTELKTVPALVMLVLILLIRPQGILGRSQRVG